MHKCTRRERGIHRKGTLETGLEHYGPTSTLPRQLGLATRPGKKKRGPAVLDLFGGG